jgi:hypothetical protein
MAERILEWKIQEPLRTNRWLLKAGKVPAWLVRSTNLETFVEKGKTYTKLNFSLLNTVDYTIVPDDVIQLRKIKLEFLDPVGHVINGYDMNVEFEKMSLKDNTLRCFFINRPDSPYFESPIFQKIIIFLQTETNNARLKQTGRLFLLVANDLNVAVT